VLTNPARAGFAVLALVLCALPSPTFALGDASLPKLWGVKSQNRKLAVRIDELRLQATDLDKYPLAAITQRPMAMYHSWDSQNAWLRQIHAHNYLHVNTRTAREAGIEDGDWMWVESMWGKVRCMCRHSESVEPGTGKPARESTPWTPPRPGSLLLSATTAPPESSPAGCATRISRTPEATPKCCPSSRRTRTAGRHSQSWHAGSAGTFRSAPFWTS